MKKPKPNISASEAILGFIGWVTSREDPVIISRTHDVTAIVSLAAEWMRANRLPPPRANVWPNNILCPEN